MNDNKNMIKKLGLGLILKSANDEKLEETMKICYYLMCKYDCHIDYNEEMETNLCRNVTLSVNEVEGVLEYIAPFYEYSRGSLQRSMSL